LWKKLDVSALLEIVDEGRSLVFTNDYSHAEAKLRIAGDGFSHILGPHHWLSLVAKFEAALMHLAEQVSCSSTVAPRFLQESLSFLNARRHEYICQDSNLDLEQVKDIMSLMRRLTYFWMNVVTNQKAAKDLASLLGSDHTHVLRLKRHLKRREAEWKLNTYAPNKIQETHRNDYEQVRERVLKATENHDPWKQTGAVAAHCDHVPEGERAEMLANAQTAEPILTKAAMARVSHRTNALLGAAFSFGGDHNRAEGLLENVHQQPNIEICPENKVHHLLFYAEHKTREGSWDLARSAMQQIRHMWQDRQDSLPENLKRYFKPRIKGVLRAISSCLTIDDASNHKLTSLANHQGSPLPSLESSLTNPSSPDSDMLDEAPRTPSVGWPSPSTAVKPTDSPGSLTSQIWNDALASLSPKPGKELGKSVKELSLTDIAPQVFPWAGIHLRDNFAAGTIGVGWNPSKSVGSSSYRLPAVPNQFRQPRR
jgi:hypothetical protein